MTDAGRNAILAAFFSPGARHLPHPGSSGAGRVTLSNAAASGAAAAPSP